MKKFKIPKIIRLNIGCGETKIRGYVNIDVEKKTKPDIVFDIRKFTLPFRNATVTQINCIHNIEHIEVRYWPHVFSEFHRVLKNGAQLILAYPEFEKCAKNFLENHRGLKDFWRATLYGRQLYPGDYHVVPMVTTDLVKILQSYGFDPIKYGPEEHEPYNTFLAATKAGKLTREDVFNKEVFKNKRILPR